MRPPMGASSRRALKGSRRARVTTATEEEIQPRYGCGRWCGRLLWQATTYALRPENRGTLLRILWALLRRRVFIPATAAPALAYLAYHGGWPEQLGQ